MPRTVENLVINASATLLEAMAAIDRGACGIALVCDATGKVVGTITDGDIRRAVLRGATLESAVAAVMSQDYVWVGVDAGRAEILDLMRAHTVNQVPVIDSHGRLVAVHTVKEVLGRVERPNWAVVLAGGRGTRLKPYTQSCPKPMLRVAGRPILERLVLHLAGWGIRRVFLSVNYMADMIESHFGDGTGFGCQIEYLRETEPLGTGGPLSLLRDLPSHPVLVMNGDLVTQVDVGRLLRFHESGEYAATVGARSYTIDIPYGVATLDGERLVALQEKPTQRFVVNAGIYVLRPELLAWVPRNGRYPITDLVERCIQEGRSVGVHLIEDDWADIGDPDELRRARGEP